MLTGAEPGTWGVRHKPWPLALLALLAALPLLSEPASAQCAPDPAAAGDLVTCSATDTDGFDGSAVDGLDVYVDETAVVTRDPAANSPRSTIVLRDGTTTSNILDLELGGRVISETPGAPGSPIAAIQAGNGNEIINRGTVEVEGDHSVGILVGDDAIVRHQGLIRLGSGVLTDSQGNPDYPDYVTGIRAGDNARIGTGSTSAIKRGGIFLGGTGLVGIEVGDDTTDAPLLDSNGAPVLDPDGNPIDAFEIEHFGEIELQAAGSTGIKAGANTEVGIAFDFDGISFDPGRVAVTGDDSIAVLLGSGSTLTNLGSVEGSAGANSWAIVGDGGTQTVIVGALGKVSGDTDLLGGDDTLTNAGGIDGDVYMGSGDDTLENLARLNGNVDMGSGDDELRIDATAEITGQADGGAGTNDRVQLQGTGSGSMDLSTLKGFESLDIVDGGQWKLSGGGSLGTVTLADGTVQLDGPVALVNGQYVQQGGTTLSVKVDPVTGKSGQLLVGGSVDIQPGAQLALQTTNPIPNQTSIAIVDATGGVTGSFTPLFRDTAALSYVMDSTALNQRTVQVTRRPYGSLGATPGQQAVGSYFDQLLAYDPSGGSAAQAFVQLDSIGLAQMQDTLAAMNPEVFDAHTGAGFANGTRVAHLAMQTRSLCKPSMYDWQPRRRPDAPCGDAGFAPWMAGSLTFGDRDTGSDYIQVDSHGHILLAGMDYRIAEPWLLTGWFGVTSNELDVEGVGDGDFKTIEAGLGTLVRLGPARLRAAFGYGFGSHDQDRKFSVAGVNYKGNSDFNSNRINSLVEMGYAFRRGALEVEPLVGMDFTWLVEEDFEEDGQQALMLDVDERDNTLFATGVGARVGYRYVQPPFIQEGPKWADGVWHPEVSLRWRSVWEGDDREVKARLVNMPAAAGEIHAPATGADQGADLAARLTFHPYGATGSLSLGYQGFYAVGDASTTAHRVGAEMHFFF